MDVKIEVPDPIQRERGFLLMQIWDVRNDVLDLVGPNFEEGQEKFVVEAIDKTIDGVLGLLDGVDHQSKDYVLLPRHFFKADERLPNMNGNLAETFEKMFLTINEDD